MIGTSALFSQKIAESSRQFRARLLYEGAAVSGEIRNITINKGACGESFSIGSIYSPYIEVTLDKCEEILENKELLLQIGLVIDDTVDYIDMGYYTVTKPSRSTYQTTFTAVGRITSKLNCLPTLPAEQTLAKLAAAITEATGIQIICKGVTLVGAIEEDLTGLTCRELLEVITAVLGGFATEDNAGNIVISKFSTADLVHFNGERTITDPEFSDYDYELTGVKVISKEEWEDEDETVHPEVSFTEGTPRQTLSMKYMTASLFSAFKANVVGYTYRPGTIPLALGDPRLDPWDCILYTDAKGREYVVPCLNIVHTFDGGLSTMITAPGESESESEIQTKGPLIQQMERMNYELLTAKEAIIKRLKVDELESEVAKLGYASVQELSAINAAVGTLTAKDAEITGQLTATDSKITNLSGEFATFKSGEFETLKSKAITTETLESEVGKFGYLKTEELEAKVGTFGYVKTTDLEAEVGEFGYLKSDELEVEVGKFGYLKANEAKLAYATISDLRALETNIDRLQTDVADIDTLIFGSASGTTIQTSFANAVIAQLGNAQIKSAMIDTIAADKITSGDIITNNIKVTSEDGRLLISDETIQISDDTRVRVQIGKDASNDYSINIWDADGNLMFSKGGITDSAIKEAIIRNEMVAANANISASKLDISSLFTEINNSTETIKSTKIYLDDEGQTLDVAFTRMISDIDDLSDDVTSQGTALSVVQGQISSKVWQADIHTATKDLATEDSVTALSTQYSELNQTVGGISAVVAGHDTEIAKKADSSTVTAVSNKVTEIEADLAGFTVSVSNTYATKTALSETDKNISDHAETLADHESRISVNEGAISLKVSSTEFNNYKTIVTENIASAKSEAIEVAEEDATAKADAAEEAANDYTDGKVETVTAEVNTVKSIVAEHTTSFESITSRVASTESSITTINGELDSLETRMNAAELKITDSAIIATVSGTYATKTDLNATDTKASNAVNNVEALEVRVAITESSIASQASEISAQGTKISTLEQTAEGFTLRLENVEADAIVSTVEQFYQSTSPITLSGGNWQEDQPTWTDGKYIWLRTLVTYGNGVQEYTPSENGVCITGNTGTPGATGQGIESVTVQYYKSTSKTAQSGGSWSDTMPTWANNTYLWIRYKVVYKNPVSTVYTTPILDNSWEAVKEAEKTATNFIQGTTEGLVIGDMTASMLDRNVLITAADVQIRNGTTVLASFDEDEIYLGKNTPSAIIHLCGNIATLSGYSVDNGAYEALAITSNYIRLSAIAPSQAGAGAAPSIGVSLDKVYVSGPLDVTGTLNATGAVTFGGTLRVSGTSTLGRINASNEYLTGSLYVGGKSSTSDGKPGVAFGASGNITMQSTGTAKINFINGTNTSAKAYIASGSSNDISLVAPGYISFILNESTLDVIKYMLSASDTSISYFYPVNDTACRLGSTSNRWYRLYQSYSSVSTSDKRQKENIKALKDIRKHRKKAGGSIEEFDVYDELFNRLEPVEYNFIEGENRKDFGLIAQDVIAVMEELGLEENELDLVHHDTWVDEETGEERDGYGIAYENLIPLLINEVQKLKESNNKLNAHGISKARQESTETKLTAAMMKIAELEKEIEQLKLAS